MSPRASLYLRNIIFGIEDSLVSTVGLLAGLAAGGAVPARTLLLTGVIALFVEGFSMAVGSFLSEESVEEYQAQGKAFTSQALLGAVVMFCSFVIAGFIPVAPYLLFTGDTAIFVSAGLSLAALTLLAFVHARLARVPSAPRILRMVLLGGFAILIGIVVGKVFGIV